MLIRKNEDNVEIYNDDMELLKVFENATYYHRDGKYHIHSLSSVFVVYMELPEQMTAIIHISPKQ